MAELKKCLCGADAETFHTSNDYGEHYRTRCSISCQYNWLLETRGYFRSDTEEAWNENVTTAKQNKGELNA